MIKRIATGVLTGVIALTLVGCGSGINNSTALDAAKTFTQAEIDGDSKVLKEIDHSNALIYPPQTVLDNASRLGYSKHKLDEFKFEQVDDITVNVTGPKDIPSKSLIFTKEDGKYYFINFDSIKKLQSTQEQVQSTQSAQPTQSTQSTQPPQPTQSTKNSNFTYKVISGQAQIRYKGTGGAVTIPSSIDGFPVTSIGDFAFSTGTGGTEVTSINIPQGVTSIGICAFDFCPKLKNVSLPQSLKSIGKYDFKDTTSLTSIDIPQGVTSIGESAFSNSSITSINIPQGVTIIEKAVFGNCLKLTSVSVPQWVTSIGAFAFVNDEALTTITINSATTTIADDKSTIPETTTIIGHDPSTAKTYATKYNRKFEVLK